MNRIALNNAFKELRHFGFIARQNFLCCNSCADFDLSERVSSKIDKDANQKDKIKGCVYYHQQAAQEMNRGGDLFLNYGCFELEKHGVVGLSTIEVGRAAVHTFEKYGFTVEWDENPDKKIRIKNI